MKKFVSILLAVIMCTTLTLALIGCGSSNPMSKLVGGKWIDVEDENEWFIFNEDFTGNQSHTNPSIHGYSEYDIHWQFCPDSNTTIELLFEDGTVYTTLTLVDNKYLKWGSYTYTKSR